VAPESNEVKYHVEDLENKIRNATGMQCGSENHYCYTASGGGLVRVSFLLGMSTADPDQGSKIAL